MQSLIDDALRLLGIRRFALQIHDASFPSASEEDLGRGSPYSLGAMDFLRFARQLGFNALQLGPQGIASPGDPSPYNGSIFSKSTLSLAWLRLCEDDRLSAIISPADIERTLESLHADGFHCTPQRVNYQAARRASHDLLDLLYGRFRLNGRAMPELSAAFEAYVSGQTASPVDWFDREAIYEAFCAESGTDDWHRWNLADQQLYSKAPEAEHSRRLPLNSIRQSGALAIGSFALGQFLLDMQHRHLQHEAFRLGLLLYGDMHIGLSLRDQWAWQALFLPGYLVGAPPSRTNPRGQPWNYPVFHPGLVQKIDPGGAVVDGPVIKLVRARVHKMLVDFDGIRIDHPQGLVCPWVYRSDLPDVHAAVQNGARLHSSPDLVDHPDLRQFSIVRPDQLNLRPGYPRYGDEYVTGLEPEQVERYAILLDVVVECAKARHDILCEVLSTWPRPLREVMVRRGLGRFCITQKADPNRPDDVYRPENTSAEDWLMVGNHDNKPLRGLVAGRLASRWMWQRAQLLAARLIPDPVRRAEFAAELAMKESRFCDAMFAELFLGPARQVSIFWGDLFGERQPYNVPGTISGQNWTLRLPSGYRDLYRTRVRAGEAVNIPKSLAMALRAKARTLGPDAVSLANRLEEPGP